MRKFFASLLALIFILLASPLTFASGILNTILNPSFLTKDEVIATIHQVALSKIEDEFDAKHFTIFPGFNKEKTMAVINHILTKDFLVEETLVIQNYVNNLKPFQSSLPPLTFDLTSFKENLISSPPPGIPIHVIKSAAKSMPTKPTVNLPIPDREAKIISTILAFRAYIQIILLVIILIPAGLIILILRKRPRAMCVILGIANLIVAIITKFAEMQMGILALQQLTTAKLDFVMPIVSLVIKDFSIKTYIFGGIGIILIILGIVVCRKREEPKNAVFKPEIKKKIKGILKKGSAKL